jgi:hypothetical protein
VLTINWHDRSIAPERLWDDFYLKLLQELKSRGAWIATAAQVVAWFRKRRAAALDFERTKEGKIRVQAHTRSDTLPDLKIRIQKPRARSFAGPAEAGAAPEVVNVRFGRATELSLAI